MCYYKINGGRKLWGSLSIKGAKNAVLPILAASALTDESTLVNCPQLTDVDAAAEILRGIGFNAELCGDSISIKRAGGGSPVIEKEIMEKMRSSILFLSSILTNFGCAKVYNPGGCALGARPIDLHIKALEAMGAVFEYSDDAIFARLPKGFSGAEIDLPFPSVGATENIIIAGAKAFGYTYIRGAAKEPEIDDLIAFINECGGKIKRLKGGSVFIEGVKHLTGCTHKIIPDRIAAGTYLGGAAVTGGDILLNNVNPVHMLSYLGKFAEAGCDVKVTPDTVRLRAEGRLKAFTKTETGPYPAFPTDMQAIMMAVSAKAIGESEFCENIFTNRFAHTKGLCALGADITCHDRCAVVKGRPYLYGSVAAATDLRGGAGLVIAALGARGESKITKIEHILRGYESFDENLRSLGADIIKIG